MGGGERRRIMSHNNYVFFSITQSTKMDEDDRYTLQYGFTHRGMVL